MLYTQRDCAGMERREVYTSKNALLKCSGALAYTSHSNLLVAQWKAYFTDCPPEGSEGLAPQASDGRIEGGPCERNSYPPPSAQLLFSLNVSLVFFPLPFLILCTVGSPRTEEEKGEKTNRNVPQ